MFSDPDAANRAKTTGLIICNKRVLVSKYKKEHIRCLKCRGWNHIVAECILNVDRCGTCGTRGHHMSACTNTNTIHCRSCGTDDHTSWDRECPTFIRKCQEFDIKHPENDLPYYPSTEQWTWLTSVLPPEPFNRYRAEAGLPICQTALSKQLRQRKLQFGLAAHSENVIGPIGPSLHTAHVPPSLKVTGGAWASRKETLVVRPPFPYPEWITLENTLPETLHSDANPPIHLLWTETWNHCRIDYE